MVLLKALGLAGRFVARRFAARGAARTAIGRVAGRFAQRVATFGQPFARRIPSRIRTIRGTPALKGSRRISSRVPKVLKGAKPSLPRRVGRFVGRAALGAGAFIAAEAGIRRLIGRRGARAATAGGRQAIAGGAGVVRGTGVLPTTATGGAGVGLLSRFGKPAAIAAGIGAGLFGAEQLAERFGVRGGAGFIGRRPTSAAEAAAMGVPVRRRRKQLLITRPEMRAVRSLKSKVKRISKALSLLGMKVVRTGTRAAGISPGVITRPEARRAFKK